MIEKIYKKVLFTLILLFTLTFSFIVPEVNAAPSNEKYVIPGGNSIGLKIDTGVYIAGKYEVKTSNDKVSPWMMSDIEVGDKIIKYNDLNVLNANNLITFLNHETNDKVRLTILRNKRTLQTNIKVVETVTGAKSLGLYLKDKLLGVGTLTFIDPDSKLYGSLGHGIYDQKVIIGDVDGTLTFSNVESIKKGNAGLPGEKRASLSKKEIGDIAVNNITGVYGKIKNENLVNNQKRVKVASQDEIVLGPAHILTVIDGEKIEKFDIEVVEINKQNSRNIKGIKIKVTDEELLNKTGGIIQGMSGSPIIQNNKLIGAVSHVIVDNPSYGYGIHIEWMLNELLTIKH